MPISINDSPLQFNRISILERKDQGMLHSAERHAFDPGDPHPHRWDRDAEWELLLPAVAQDAGRRTEHIGVFRPMGSHYWVGLLLDAQETGTAVEVHVRGIQAFLPEKHFDFIEKHRPGRPGEVLLLGLQSLP